jgi:hypothetical protein
MEREIRSDARFLEKAGQRFVLVKVDFPRQEWAVSQVNDVAANDQLKKQFGISVFPTIVLADASGAAYGYLGYQEGGAEPFWGHIDKLLRIRSERDALLRAVDEAKGDNKLYQAKRTLDFLSTQLNSVVPGLDHRMLLQTLKNHVPEWTKLAEQWDPQNQQNYIETFFDVDWTLKYHVAPPSELKSLLDEIGLWKKSHGEFNDKDRGARIALNAARAHAELGEFEAALRWMDEGLKLEPKDQLTLFNLRSGPLALGLSTGTAFAINDSGHFLTNAHVAGGHGKVFLVFPDQQKLVPGEVVAEGQKVDLAVVKIDLPKDRKLVPLQLASEYVPEIAQPIATWGHPLGTVLGQGVTFTKGDISSLPEAVNRNMLKLNLTVNPGNSGGPLCNPRGQVIGVVTAQTLQAPVGGAPIQPYALAVTSKNVAAFLRANRIGFLSDAVSAVNDKDGGTAKPKVSASLPWDEVGRRVSPAVAMVIKVRLPKPEAVTLVDGHFYKQFKLDQTDGMEPGRRLSLAKAFNVDLNAGTTYWIDMRSKDIDCYLRLTDAAKKELAADDDSGGGQDARIVFACPADGTYTINATTFSGRSTGTFFLEVTEAK